MTLDRTDRWTNHGDTNAVASRWRLTGAKEKSPLSRANSGGSRRRAHLTLAGCTHLPLVVRGAGRRLRR